MDLPKEERGEHNMNSFTSANVNRVFNIMKIIISQYLISTVLKIKFGEL